MRARPAHGGITTTFWCSSPSKTFLSLRPECLSMSTDPRVIAELRSLFQEGNTPSALIKHIVRSHPGEQGLFSLIQAYFREGFATSLVRVSAKPEDYTSFDLRLA